jgi:hypothetical protein
MSKELETFLAAIGFVAIFLFGGNFRVTRKGWRRSAVSASAGAAVAYVFIHLLPDLGEASKNFVAATIQRTVSLGEAHVHTAALFSFVIFYGLEHLVKWSHQPEQKEATERSGNVPVFLIHIIGFGLYAALVCYMMVRGREMTTVAITLYAVAMGLHFLSIDHSLLEEHGSRHLKSGRYILAGAVLVGWGCGLLFEIPKAPVATLTGLVAGGVIMNSMIMELPREKDGKFWPFVAGAAGYAAIMLLATGIRVGGKS